MAKAVVSFKYIPVLSLMTMAIVGYLQTAEASVYITTTATAQTKTAYTGIAYNASFSTTSFVVAQFLGIPYAQPPTGSKRFAKPVINSPAVGWYDASKLGNICPQHSNSGDPCISSLAPSMDEDCLYLNIYVPLPNMTASDVESGVNRTLPTGKQYPVFFYIHGGGYYLGSGNCYNGTNLAGLGEVIVVTSNYRLGILGFMATGDDVISGNLALWDQWTALRWVNQNIAAFGGDPNLVTIGGHSAGGIISTLMAMFPQDTPELFQRVFALSGTALMPKTFMRDDYNTALTVANDLGCNIQGQGKSAEIKDCLMGMSTSQLVKGKFTALTPMSFPLETSISEPLVPKSTYFLSQALSKYKSKTLSVPASFYKKDLFLGTSQEDGVVFFTLREYFLANALINTTLFYVVPPRTVSLSDFKQIVFEILANKFTDNMDDYKVEIDSIMNRYIQWEKPNDLVLQSRKLVDMFTDLGFVIPHADTALAHVLGPIIDSAGTGGKTFMYKFSKAYTNAEAKMLFNFFEGTEHDADIPYVFGFVSGSDDIALSKTFMSYVINFIKAGDPNGPGLTQWKEFNAETQPYMYISTNTVEQREYFGASIQQFWNELIPSLKQCKGSSSAADRLQNTVLVAMVSVAWSIYRFVVCINYN
ncbi:neuroligin-4 Y-linked [Biomphalaria glabrata]